VRSYLDILGDADGKPVRSLAFKICGIPDNIHHGRISQVLWQLRNFSRILSVEVSRPSLGNIDPAEARIAAVSFRFDRLKPIYRRDPEKVSSFVRKLRRRGLKFAISGINSNDDTTVVAALKPDFYSVIAPS
jgi:hypothetical protein